MSNESSCIVRTIWMSITVRQFCQADTGAVQRVFEGAVLFLPQGTVPAGEPSRDGPALVQGHLGHVVGWHGVGEHALDPDHLGVTGDLVRGVEADSFRSGCH